MKRSKFKDLVNLAGQAINIPKSIEIESMEVEKYIYLQEDTLLPVILVFSNFISTKLFDKELFNIKVYKKADEALCLGKIIEDGEDDSDDTESEAIRLLVLMEALDAIFNPKNKSTLDLTSLVLNWRKTLSLLDENEEINQEEHIKMLIINNMQYLKTKNDMRLGNENI